MKLCVSDTLYENECSHELWKTYLVNPIRKKIIFVFSPNPQIRRGIQQL